MAGNPRQLGRAVLRRIVPASPRYGHPWVKRPDGTVTFHERGFVAATNPSGLLARHNYETRRIRQELSGSVNRRSLELGCGFGRLSMTFAEFSEDHQAVDVNADALASASTAYPEIAFEVTSPSALSFPADHFDLVCSWTVLQHVQPHTVQDLCDEVRRVLAPGGTLLLCEETRCPDVLGDATWHRSVKEYESLFAPLVLRHHGYIEEIDRIPGMTSPGEIMHFKDMDG